MLYYDNSYLCFIDKIAEKQYKSLDNGNNTQLNPT